MGDDGGDPMETSATSSATAAPKASRKRQNNADRANNFRINTDKAQDGHVKAHMASAQHARERVLKQANDTLEQLREDMLGAAPLLSLILPPCTSDKCEDGEYEVDPKLFPHTVAARDFCRKDVQLPRVARCSGCGDEQYLNPLLFGFFSANPVKKVCKEVSLCLSKVLELILSPAMMEFRFFLPWRSFVLFGPNCS